MNPTRKPLMAGNWKMYKTALETSRFIKTLAESLKALDKEELPDVVLCPSFVSINVAFHTLKEAKTSIALGAQNMDFHDEGAFTGEIAPAMLAEFGVQYVILGHSERRQYFNETDESVNQKTRVALSHRMTPIVCVGESLTQREAGQTDDWVAQQVKAALTGLTDEEKQRLVIAYEPIWAIGTGKVCEADEANRVIGWIRQVADCPEMRVLYGGSMKPDNVVGLMAQPEIDGGLVGGASLQTETFFPLIQAAMLSPVA